MSLINKMLQDLDARGQRGQGAAGGNMSPAPSAEPGRRLRTGVVISVVVFVAIAATGLYLWRTMQRPPLPRPIAAAPPAAKPAVVASIATALTAPVELATAPREVLPKDEPKPKPTPEKVAAPSASAPAKSAPSASVAAKLAPSASVAAKSAPTASTVASVSAVAEASGPAPVKLQEQVGDKPSKKLKAAQAKAKAGASALRSAPVMAPLEMTPQQRAESGYRKALASLQEGRMTDAVASLEQCLRLDPYHDAARQTLVGLMIESRRADDAVRHLQLGLTLEPRQPAMAMLLARLQIEQGGSGIDTLMRTLPYATGNAEYHAFLAGALQRESRHQEAAEQYRTALRNMPQNGVWLIGLGISLQAEKRNAEALDAFRRAKAAPGLSTDLLSFVDRKITTLNR